MYTVEFPPGVNIEITWFTCGNRGILGPRTLFNLRKMADYDSDYERVLDIIDASSGSEFSGFSSEETDISSDDDSVSEDWENAPENDGTDDRTPRCVLPAGPKLPRDFDVKSAGALDYFTLFVPMDVYDHIARETNSYAELVQREKGEMDDRWTDTSGPEIRAFIGLNILMGASPRHSYEDYWRDNDFLGSPGFKNTMTYNRYEKLSQYIHVNTAAARERRDDPNYHPVNKVKPLYDVTNQNFRRYCQHSTEISIDEAMKGYKGRSELRQYMPDKPEKFGIKFWARCDGRTSYMSMYQLYTGKRDRTPIQLQHGLGYRVVHDLTRDLGGLNHHVYHDRFFTGVTLATDLLLEDIYTCGTLNPNRKEIPPQLRQKKAIIKREIPQRGDSVAFKKDGLSVTAWNDNNVVLVLHNNSSSDPVRCERQVGRNRQMIPQPKAIADYNRFMNGVDLHDQMRKKYSCGRASKKYWKYLMWFIIDCARTNAYIIFREASERTLRRKRFTQLDFVTELGESLIGNFCGRKRLCVREILSPLDVNDNQMPHVHVRMEGLRRRCKHCYARSVRKEVVKGCAVCNIHMCSQCFLEKH